MKALLALLMVLGLSSSVYAKDCVRMGRAVKEIALNRDAGLTRKQSSTLIRNIFKDASTKRFMLSMNDLVYDEASTSAEEFEKKTLDVCTESQ
jgi:hypothetical protein